MKIKNLLIILSSLFLSFAAFAGGHKYSGPDLTGQKVVMFGPWLSPEQETMREVGAIFEKATGATFEYGGSDSFEQQVMIDLKAGSAADLVVFPQPGLAANAAAMGGLVPLGDDIKQMVLDNYAAGQSWVDLSTYADENGNDQFNAIFFRTNVKSLVWYSPDNFEDNGYEVPGTMEELIALTRQMASDGNTPWCIGLGSGAATGWPATDWMEDIMLRTHTPDVYDMCKWGREKYQRWNKVVGESNGVEKIKEYGKKNPTAPIIVQNKQSGEMQYLRFGNISSELKERYYVDTGSES